MRRISIFIICSILASAAASSSEEPAPGKSIPEMLRRLYEACRMHRQQTGRFPASYGELGGLLSEEIRRAMPARVEFLDPDAAESRLLRRSPIGERTPCLRLKLPNGRWLNVAGTGWIFESDLYWESEFVDLLPRPFTNVKLLAVDSRSMPERAATRSSRCGPNQLDLVPHCDAIPSLPWFQGPSDDGQGNLFNGGEKSPPAFAGWFVRGVYEHGGILFDVRGVIQLDGQLSPEGMGPRTYRSYPTEVRGIPVHLTVRALRLLAGTVGRAPPRAEVAALRFHFASGETSDVPLRYGEDIAAADDASYVAERLYPPPPTLLTNQSVTDVIYSLHHVRLLNPRPEDMIEAIDFLSGLTTSHPFILAITVEQ